MGKLSDRSTDGEKGVNVHADDQATKSFQSTSTETKHSSRTSSSTKRSSSSTRSGFDDSPFQDLGHTNVDEYSCNVEKTERHSTTTDDGRQRVTVTKESVENSSESSHEPKRKHAIQSVTIQKEKSGEKPQVTRPPDSVGSLRNLVKEDNLTRSSSEHSIRPSSLNELQDDDVFKVEDQETLLARLQSQNSLIRTASVPLLNASSEVVRGREVTRKSVRVRHQRTKEDGDKPERRASSADTDRGVFTVLSKPKVPWLLSSQELKQDIKRKKRPLSCEPDFFSGFPNIEPGKPSRDSSRRQRRYSTGDRSKVTGQDLLSLRVKTEDVPLLRKSFEGGKLIRIRSLNDLTETEFDTSSIKKSTTRTHRRKKTTEESVREKLAELRREAELRKKNRESQETNNLSDSNKQNNNRSDSQKQNNNLSDSNKPNKQNSERAETHVFDSEHSRSDINSTSRKTDSFKSIVSTVGKEDFTEVKNHPSANRVPETSDAADQNTVEPSRQSSYKVGILKRTPSAEDDTDELFERSDELFSQVRELRKSCEDLLDELDVQEDLDTSKELSNFRFTATNTKSTDNQLSTSHEHTVQNENSVSASSDLHITEEAVPEVYTTSLQESIPNVHATFSQKSKLDLEDTKLQREIESVTDEIVRSTSKGNLLSDSEQDSPITDEFDGIEEAIEVDWEEVSSSTGNPAYEYFIEKSRTRIHLRDPEEKKEDVDEGICILKEFIEQLIVEDRAQNIHRIKSLTEESESGYFSEDEMSRKAFRRPELGARTSSMPEMTRTEFLEKRQNEKLEKKRRNSFGGSNPDLPKRVLKVKVPSRLLQGTAASRGKQKKKVDYTPIDKKPDMVYEERLIRAPESGWTKQKFVQYPEPKSPRIQRAVDDQVVEDFEETVEWQNPRGHRYIYGQPREQHRSSFESAGPRIENSDDDVHPYVEKRAGTRPPPVGRKSSFGKSEPNGWDSDNNWTETRVLKRPQEKLLPKRKVWSGESRRDEEYEEIEDELTKKKTAYFSRKFSSEFKYNTSSVLSNPSTIFSPLSSGTHDTNTFKYVYTIDAEMSYREYNKLMSIINMLQEQKKKWEEEVTDVKDKFDKTGKEKMQLAHNNHILRQSLEAANRAIKEINGKVQELKQTLVPLREDNSTLREQNIELKQKIDIVQKEKETFVLEIQSLKKTHSSVEESVHERESEMEEYKSLMHEKFRKLEEAYRKYRDDMEEKHKVMYGESNDIRHHNETLRREVDTMRKESIHLMNEINDLKRKNDDLKLEVSRKPDTVTASEEFKQMSERKDELERQLTNELDRYKEETRQLESENDQLKTDLENMESKLKELETRDEIRAQEHTIEGQQIEVLRGEIDELKHQLREFDDMKQKRSHLVDERDRYRNQVDELQVQLMDMEYLKRENSFMEKDIKRHRDELESLQERVKVLDQLKAERITQTAENDRLKQELEHLREQLRILENKQLFIDSPYNDELKNELQNLRNQMKDLANMNQQKAIEIQNDQLKGELESLRNQIRELDFSRNHTDSKVILHQQSSESKTHVTEKDRLLEKHIYMRDSEGHVRAVRPSDGGLVADAPNVTEVDGQQAVDEAVTAEITRETYAEPVTSSKSPTDTDSLYDSLQQSSDRQAVRITVRGASPSRKPSEEKASRSPTRGTRVTSSHSVQVTGGKDQRLDDEEKHDEQSKQDRIDEITKRHEEKGSVYEKPAEGRVRRRSTGAEYPAALKSSEMSRLKRDRHSERSKTTEIHTTTTSESTHNHTVEHHHHHHYHPPKVEDTKDEAVGPDEEMTEEQRKIIEERIKWRQQHDTMWSLRTPDITKLQRRSIEADMDKVAEFDQDLLPHSDSGSFPRRTFSLDRHEIRKRTEEQQRARAADASPLVLRKDGKERSKSPHTTKDSKRFEKYKKQHQEMANQEAKNSTSTTEKNASDNSLKHAGVAMQGNISVTAINKISTSDASRAKDTSSVKSARSEYVSVSSSGRMSSSHDTLQVDGRRESASKDAFRRDTSARSNEEHDGRSERQSVQEVSVEPQAVVPAFTAPDLNRQHEIARLRQGRRDDIKISRGIKTEERSQKRAEDQVESHYENLNRHVEARRDVRHEERITSTTQKKRRTRSEDRREMEERRLKSHDHRDSSSDDEQNVPKERIGRPKYKRREGARERSASRDAPITRSEPIDPNPEWRGGRVREIEITRQVAVKDGDPSADALIRHQQAILQRGQRDGQASFRRSNGRSDGLLQIATNSSDTRIIGLQTKETVERREHRQDTTVVRKQMSEEGHVESRSSSNGRKPPKPRKLRDERDSHDKGASTPSLDSQKHVLAKSDQQRNSAELQEHASQRSAESRTGSVHRTDSQRSAEIRTGSVHRTDSQRSTKVQEMIARQEARLESASGQNFERSGGWRNESYMASLNVAKRPERSDSTVSESKRENSAMSMMASSARTSRRESHDQRMAHFEKSSSSTHLRKSSDGLQQSLRQSEIDAMERARLKMLDKVSSGDIKAVEESKVYESVDSGYVNGHITVDGVAVQRRKVEDFDVAEERSPLPVHRSSGQDQVDMRVEAHSHLSRSNGNGLAAHQRSAHIMQQEIQQGHQRTGSSQSAQYMSQSSHELTASKHYRHSSRDRHRLDADDRAASMPRNIKSQRPPRTNPRHGPQYHSIEILSRDKEQDGRWEDAVTRRNKSIVNSRSEEGDKRFSVMSNDSLGGFSQITYTTVSEASFGPQQIDDYATQIEGLEDLRSEVDGLTRHESMNVSKGKRSQQSDYRSYDGNAYHHEYRSEHDVRRKR